jgi:hypothetical protein
MDVFYGTSSREDALIMSTLERVFSVLKTWRRRKRDAHDLTFDICIYSPSDSEHWFKHFTFRPDSITDLVPERRDRPQAVTLDGELEDHPWEHTTSLGLVPPEFALERVFAPIMGSDPFGNEVSKEERWWRRQPFVPVITRLLIRQQNRLRWDPYMLSQMISHLPGLREFHYEPWREFYDDDQKNTDQGQSSLFSFFCFVL